VLVSEDKAKHFAVYIMNVFRGNRGTAAFILNLATR